MSAASHGMRTVLPEHAKSKLSIAVVILVVLAVAIAVWPSPLTLIGSRSFLPHGFCYMWNKQLLTLHVVSDSLIFLSYLAISCAIAHLWYQERRRLPFDWIFVGFGLFIVTCGFTHAMDVVVLWIPYYWLAGDLKLLTAIASISTAISLPMLVPKIRLILKQSESSRLNELRFVAAAESSMDCLYLADAVRDANGEIVDFLITYVNGNAVRLVTFPIEKLIGGRMCELFPINRKIGLFDRYKHIVEEGDSFVGEFPIEEANIRTAWLRIQATRLGDGVAITASDITARKEQEEAIRKSEALLARTERLTNTGGWEVDLLTSEVSWSAEVYRILGVSREVRPTLDKGMEFYVPEDRPRIRSAIEKSVAGGEGWDMECTVVRTDGRHVQVRVVGGAEFKDGKPIRLAGAFKDITQQVAERLALTSAKDRLSLATNSGGIGIWDWDVAKNSLFWDEWMYRLYGMESGEAGEAFETWSRHLHPDDRESAEQQFRDALNGVGLFNTDFRIQWDDGSLHYIHATAIMIRDEAGLPARMIGTNSDVTTQKEAEQHLRKSYNEKDLLLREVHHRVKNNLAVIASLLYLQAEDAKDPQLSMLLQKSQNRLHSMALVHETLYRSEDLAEIDFGSYASLLADQLFSSHHPSNQSILLVKDLEFVPVPIDRAVPCGLILNELLVNSFKHAFPNGRRGSITVAVKKSSGGLVTVAVSDDGAGSEEPYESDSLGRHLVQALAAQIDGTFQLLPGNPGTRALLTLEV